MATDAFGRLRTSEAFTVFDNYPSALTTDDTWIEITDGTTNTGFSSGYYSLGCSSNSSEVTRISKIPMEYQPGKSRLFYMSSIPVVVSGSGHSYKIRMGLMSLDGSNEPVEGVWFETDGTTLSFVEKTNSGTTTINQSSWSVDIFDGNGASGKTVTASTLNTNMIILIDQEWLGVGRVRVGLNIDGVNYYAHEFNHTLTHPYSSTPRLRLCFQNKMTTYGGSGSVELRKICCTNISESGYLPLGRAMSVNNGINTISTGTAGDKNILLAIRIQDNSDYVGGLLKLKNIGISIKGGTATNLVEIQLHSTYGSVGIASPAESTWSYTTLSESIVEYSTGPGIITDDGYVIASTYSDSRESVEFTGDIFETLLTRAQVTRYDSTLYDIMMVTVQSSGTNLDAATSINFIESL